MKASSFTFRLSAALAAVLLVAAAMTLLLNYSKLRRTMLAQEASIYQLVTHQLSETIEASMNLGLALSMMENTQPLLERQKERDAQILELVVHNAEGRVLFATDQARMGTTLPRNWVTGPAAGTVAQDVADAHSSLARAQLLTSFGQVAGGGVLRYSTTTTEERLSTIFTEMLRTALPIALFCMLLAYLVALVATRPLQAWLGHAGRWAASIADREPPPEGTPPAFADAAGGTFAALDEAEREIRQLETERSGNA